MNHNRVNKMNKTGIEMGVINADENGFELRSRSKMAGTEADQHDMRILGKTQQLNVSKPAVYNLSISLTRFSETSASSLSWDSPARL